VTVLQEAEDIATHLITLNRAEYAPIIIYPDDTIVDYQQYLKECAENCEQNVLPSGTLVDERILPHYYIQVR